jgi:hypothetical protein
MQQADEQFPFPCRPNPAAPTVAAAAAAAPAPAALVAPLPPDLQLPQPAPHVPHERVGRRPLAEAVRCAARHRGKGRQLVLALGEARAHHGLQLLALGGGVGGIGCDWAVGRVGGDMRGTAEGEA